MIRNLLVLPTGEELFSGVVGENAISGVKLTRCVNSEEELTPGAVCADMLEASVIVQKPLSLTAGEEVTLYTVSDSGERKQEGVFMAEKPVWESANRYTLTAYDRVSRLDKDLTGWLGGLTGWPYYLMDFAHMVCAECGLELVNTQIPNGDYPIQAFSGEGITGRQLMQWIGQAAGRFCRATKDGQIEFTWYKHTGKSIGPEEKSIQTGPENVVIFDAMTENAPLQAVSEIAPSLSGWEGVTLCHCGKNLFDPRKMVAMKRAYFNEETGLWTVDTKTLSGTSAAYASLFTKGAGLRGVRTVEDLIRVPPNTPVTITVNDWSAASTDGTELAQNNTYMGYGWYNADGSCHSIGNLNTGSVRTVVSPNIEPCYLDIRRNNAAILVSFSAIQIELGSAATDYEPFQGETYSQSFEEMIYGGSMDWNTGVLTVTHGRLDSYAGEEMSDGWISDTGQLSEGAQVVYPLPQAYTIRLTPLQIRALGGYNYLWTYSGATSAGFHQDYYFAGSLRFEDYQTAPIEKVQIRLTDEDVGAVYPDDPEKTNTCSLSGNYLLTNADAEPLESVAQCVYEQLKDITYTPCKLEIPASVEVDAGDIVTVTDKKGRSITVYVMERTVSGQRSALECTGSPRRDSSTAVNTQTYQALSGKVLNLRTDVEGLIAENKDATGKLSNLTLTVDGIDGKVSVQKADVEGVKMQMTSLKETADKVQISVQSILDNGASKVSTEFGLTIDESAVKIHRSNSPMTNTLNENGMYVIRDNGASAETVMLQADAGGVVATDVSVRNYLMIGSYARVEDYTSGRTACFWLGGE